MKIKIFNILLLMLLVASIACAQSPKIEDRRIYFANGKKIEYVPYQVINTDPEVAHKKGLPTATSEKPILIGAWQRLIIIKTLTLYEDIAKEITVYNYEGSRLNNVLTFVGEPLILKQTQRLLLAQQSSHYLINKSFLLDENGKILKEIDLPSNVYNYGHSEDDKLFWIFSNAIREGKPYTLITIVDFNGKLIKIIESDKKESLEFKYNDIIYKLDVESPKIPG